MSEDEQKPKKPGSRSPRAPSIPLDSALKKTLDVYNAEQLHPVPVDVAARHMGYKNGKSGAALGTLAALRYFGLLVRPSKGLVSVSTDVERYVYSPNASEKSEILKHWLRMPEVFSDLFDSYGVKPPSVETIRYALIKEGFRPATASPVAQSYVDSLGFIDAETGSVATNGPTEPEDEQAAIPAAIPESRSSDQQAPESIRPASATTGNGEGDKVVIRLSGGRRAWLLLPDEFYVADKNRIIAQIDVIMADDEN